MTETDTFNSFIRENKSLVKEWIEAKARVYKLKMVRVISKTAGYFIWIIISLVLVSLFTIFLGLTAGFWLSDVLGSYTRGFGSVSVLIVLVFILLTVFRKGLFINPIIRKIIQQAEEETENTETGS